MTKEWIEAKRIELKKQNEEALSVYYQTKGALAALDLVEAEENKPVPMPAE